MARDWFGEMSGGGDLVQAQAQATPQGRDWTSEVMGAATASAAPSAPKPTGNILSRMKDAVMGAHDPAYKDVPALDFVSPGDSHMPRAGSGQMWGSFTGQDDAGYGDILQKQLGPNFVRRFKDANGYDLIEYKDNKGQIKRGYVNKPGLDTDDVARTVIGAVPYLAGGLGIGAATKAAPMAGRFVAQSLGAGATSAAGDAGAAAAGADINPLNAAKKAGMTAAMGGAAEVIPSRVMAPLIGGGAGLYLQTTPESTSAEMAGGTSAGAMLGFGASVLMRRMMMSPGAWIDKTGNLTPAGQKLAVSQGLDPAQMSAFAKQEFAKTYAMSKDAAQAATRADTHEFGIPSTIGQRTKDPQQLMREKAMRSGIYGEEPKQVLQQFDRDQSEAVRGAVFGRQGQGNLPGMPRPPASYNPNAAGVGQDINPATWNVMDMAGRGEAVRDATTGLREFGRQAETDAWKKVGPMEADAVGKAIMPSEIRTAIEASGAPPIGANTPVASAMVDMLEAMTKGSAPGRPSPFLPSTVGADINEMRKTLGAMVSNAETRQDRQAAGAIYGAYNNWIETVGARGLTNNPGGAPAMADARAVSRDWKGLFEPMNRGRPAPEARRLAEIMNDANAPERVVGEIIGDATVRALPGSGRLETVTALKAMLNGRAAATKDPQIAQQGAQAWNEIRSAYWENMMLDKQGQIKTPQQLLNALRMAETNQGSVMQVLYEPAERIQMKRLERALQHIVYKDPNPSGTATGVGVLGRDLISTITNMIPSYVGKLGMSTIMAPLQRQAGKLNAAAAVNQGVREVPPSLGGYGAAVGNAFDRRN